MGEYYEQVRFIDLFAGLGGFHRALADLGHACVFASEINDGLRECYTKSFPEYTGRLVGDITDPENKDGIPEHDILCAGFPCQPFSKSGRQDGFKDVTRGTLFHVIVEILEQRQPEYVLLENVGNLERHDSGRTWKIVKETLNRLGYDVRGTEHRSSRGIGLISPHHLGYPHTRERFFIVGRLQKEGGLPPEPFPERATTRTIPLEKIIQAPHELGAIERHETRLSPSQVRTIEHWNTFIQRLPPEIGLPSFPIWADELLVDDYPFTPKAPTAWTEEELGRYFGFPDGAAFNRGQFIARLPSYAVRDEQKMPKWKQTFIDQNRKWLDEVKPYLPDHWLTELRRFPHSHRKLEWNCKMGERDIWKHVLQFRPSGLRVKCFFAIPSLVSMTETQIPILGPERRFLTRTEGLRLQGFGDDHSLPLSRAAAFAALGNAVHVGVAKAIAQRLLAASHDSATSGHTNAPQGRRFLENTQSRSRAWSPAETMLISNAREVTLPSLAFESPRD